MTPYMDDSRLTAYALGELSQPERTQVEIELQQSSAMREEVTQLKQFFQVLETGLKNEPCPELTDNQRQMIQQQMHPRNMNQTIPAKSSHSNIIPLRWFLPLAATLIASLVIVAVWQEKSSKPQLVSQLKIETNQPANASTQAVIPKPESISQQPDPKNELAPLAVILPIPAFMGTPTDIALSEYIEKPSDKPRPPIMAPKGVTNLALNKKVVCSDKNPIAGTLELVTDGDKESTDNSYLELHRGLQYVQIDLETHANIYVILLWHAHNSPQIYHDVIIQLAEDPDFTQKVRTVFNNDYDNSTGLGLGKDKEYFESYEGRAIQINGESARYVRAYSRGSTFSALNRYTEIEVYGLPNPTAHTAITSAPAAAPAHTIPPAPLQEALVTPVPQKNSTALKPVDIQLPIPAFTGTPPELVLTEYMEKPSEKPRPPFLAPEGAKNVALNKKVTSSDKNPIAGNLEQIIDGDKEAADNSYVELHRRLQWVQIDLESSQEIYAILLWHAHHTPHFYRDVILQISDDSNFMQNVQTLFNNDYDNSAGFGIGKDKEYMETYEGRLIPTQAVKARYVRIYSNGSTFSSLNRFTEIEVYARP